jgi:hypothetical protein
MTQDPTGRAEFPNVADAIRASHPYPIARACRIYGETEFREAKRLFIDSPQWVGFLPGGSLGAAFLYLRNPLQARHLLRSCECGWEVERAW